MHHIGAGAHPKYRMGNKRLNPGPEGIQPASKQIWSGVDQTRERRDPLHLNTINILAGVSAVFYAARQDRHRDIWRGIAQALIGIVNAVAGTCVFGQVFAADEQDVHTKQSASAASGRQEDHVSVGVAAIHNQAVLLQFGFDVVDRRELDVEVVLGAIRYAAAGYGCNVT